MVTQVEITGSAPKAADHRIALQAVMLAALLLDLDDRMEAMQAARRHLDIGDDQDRRLQYLEQAGFEHVFAQDDGFAAKAVDGVIDRPQAMGDGT